MNKLQAPPPHLCADERDITLINEIYSFTLEKINGGNYKCPLSEQILGFHISNRHSGRTEVSKASGAGLLLCSQVVQYHII